jgi:hypothetical protein
LRPSDAALWNLWIRFFIPAMKNQEEAFVIFAVSVLHSGIRVSVFSIALQGDGWYNG